MPFGLRVAISITLLLLAGRAGARWALHRAELAAEAELHWHGAAEGARLSAETGRPLLYDFSASWCAPCRRMKRELFGRREHAAWIGERFVCVRVEDGWDGDGLDDAAAAELRRTLEVEGFPTLLLLQDGRELGRLVGYPGRDEVLRFLGARSSDPGDETAAGPAPVGPHRSTP